MLNRNILQDAVNSVSFRMGGNAQKIASPFHAIGLNFGQMTYHRPAVFLIAGGLMVVLALAFHKPWREWLRALPLLAVSAFPIVWMLVLANHSETHYYFTFRILTVLLFGFGLYIIHCIDFDRLRRFLFRRAESK